jgi:hypothetical protein
MRLSEPQGRSGRCGDENVLFLRGIERKFLCHPDLNPVVLLTELTEENSRVSSEISGMESLVSNRVLQIRSTNFMLITLKIHTLNR